MLTFWEASVRKSTDEEPNPEFGFGGAPQKKTSVVFAAPGVVMVTVHAAPALDCPTIENFAILEVGGTRAAMLAPTPVGAV